MREDQFFGNKRIAIGIAIFCTFLWGSAFPTLKVSYEKLGIAPADIYAKMLFAGLRFFTAGFFVIFYHFLYRKKLPEFKKTSLKTFIVLGLLQTTFQYFFYYVGLGNTTGVKASILQSASTFFMVILAAFFFSDDRIHLRKALAILIGFTGILISNTTTSLDFTMTLKGEGFLLISALVGSFGMIWVKKYCKDDDPFVLTSGQMILGSMILIIVGSSKLEHPLIISSSAILLFIYACFISSTAFLLWYFLLRYHKVGEISIYRLFIPIFGALLSVIFLNDPFTINILVGMILVVIGLFVLNYNFQK
ncbi:MAG: DMT family transporter [Tissierellia bacterium]|nr:DMT family transporter [Tissierellia bacterium]